MKRTLILITTGLAVLGISIALYGSSKRQAVPQPHARAVPSAGRPAPVEALAMPVSMIAVAAPAPPVPPRQELPGLAIHRRDVPTHSGPPQPTAPPVPAVIGRVASSSVKQTAGAAAEHDESSSHPLDMPRPSLAALLSAQADEFCACSTQECVDDVSQLYMERLGSADSSNMDPNAMRTTAERMAKCDAEHRKHWGFGTSDEQPTSARLN